MVKGLGRVKGSIFAWANGSRLHRIVARIPVHVSSTCKLEVRGHSVDRGMLRCRQASLTIGPVFAHLLWFLVGLMGSCKNICRVVPSFKGDTNKKGP